MTKKGKKKKNGKRQGSKAFYINLILYIYVLVCIYIYLFIFIYLTDDVQSNIKLVFTLASKV